MSPPVTWIAAVPSVGPPGWSGLARFLGPRCIPGLERMDRDGWARRMGDGVLTVSSREGGEGRESRFHIEFRSSDAVTDERRRHLVAAVSTLVDSQTNRAEVADHLAQDPDLAVRLRAGDGLAPRLPGTLDRFELVIRAVVGQQVSVAAATTTLGRLVEVAGPVEPVAATDGSPGSGFPSAAILAEADLDRVGMPGRKRSCLRSIAEMVADGRIGLGLPGDDTDPEPVAEALAAVPGIGPWTVGYVMMRGFGRPESWPVNDLVLRQRLDVDNRGLERRARNWQPWAAQAALLLWSTPL